MRDLISYLPYVYRTRWLTEILNVAQIELEQFFTDLIESEKEYKIKTATYRLNDWAKFAGIDYNNSISMDDNRYNILATLRGYHMTTVARIKNIVESYAGATCEVYEDYPNYKFTITMTGIIGTPPNYIEIVKTIKRIKPAHLNFEIQFKYRVWDDLQYTPCKKLRGFTWREIREKEGII